jgi:hypothetical protein
MNKLLLTGLLHVLVTSYLIFPSNLALAAETQEKN